MYEWQYQYAFWRRPLRKSYFWVYVELCIPIINDVAMPNGVLIIWISSFIDNNIDVIAKSFTLSSGLKAGKDKSL